MWDEGNYDQSDSWGDTWQEYENHEHYGPATSSWRIRSHTAIHHQPIAHPYQQPYLGARQPPPQPPGYNPHPQFFESPTMNVSPYLPAQRRPLPPFPGMARPPQNHPMQMHPSPREMAYRPMQPASEAWGAVRSPDSWIHDGTTRSTGFYRGEQQLLTPHANEDDLALRRASMEEEHRIKKPRLYNDFSEPSRPKTIQLKVETSAIKCAVFWNFPDLSTKLKYKQHIEIVEVADDLVPCESEFIAPHVTNYKFKTMPGRWYTVKLSIFDQKGKMVAEGVARCKAAFCLDEIDKLMARAINATGKAMHSFAYLYRCKPKYYWDEIYMHRDGIMEKYIKDENGQAASPINGEIEGLFFSARTLPDGSLPPSSPFGDMRMNIPAFSLLNPAEINMYFSDYYCNRLTHYVTVVVCKKGSSTDNFCRDRIRPLNVRNNPFVRIEPLDSLDVPYAFYVNKTIWVEIYYTENVPMRWGKFMAIMATGAGTSRIGGLPHNKSCLTCNLYPIGPTRKAGESSNQPVEGTEMVEDLVATFESQVKDSEQDNMFERSSTRYTLLGCVQAELLSPSNAMNSSIAKEDFLEVVDVLVTCVDRVVYGQAFQNLSKFNQDKQEELYLPREEPDNCRIEPAESSVKKPSAKALVAADSRIEQSDDEITIITLSDDEDDEVVVEQEVVNQEKENNFICCEKAAPIMVSKTLSTAVSNPVKMMKILDEIVNPEAGDKNEASLSFSTSPLVRSLVNKVKALIKEMNTDFNSINESLNKTTAK